MKIFNMDCFGEVFFVVLLHKPDDAQCKIDKTSVAQTSTLTPIAGIKHTYLPCHAIPRLDVRKTFLPWMNFEKPPNE